MAVKVKADKTAQTDLARINELAKRVMAIKRKEASLRQDKKELLAEAQEIADKNRDRWFGDSKSYKTESGKLTYKVNSETVVNEEFDFEAFYGSFPHLFAFKPKYNISASEMRILLKDPDVGKQLEMLGLGVESTEKFDIEKL